MSLYSQSPALRSANKHIDRSTLMAAAHGDAASFERIYRNYRPLINKVWHSCCVDGLEYEDWCQESQLILLKVLQRSHPSSGAQFGLLFKHSLIHRILDLYRQRHAQKRIPRELLTSFEDVSTIIMMQSTDEDVETLIDVQNGLKDFWQRCSPFEQQIFKGIHCGQSPAELAHRYHCRVSAVNSAMGRCRRKLKRILKG